MCVCEFFCVDQVSSILSFLSFLFIHQVDLCQPIQVASFLNTKTATSSEEKNCTERVNLMAKMNYHFFSFFLLSLAYNKEKTNPLSSRLFNLIYLFNFSPFLITGGLVYCSFSLCRVNDTFDSRNYTSRSNGRNKILFDA